MLAGWMDKFAKGAWSEKPESDLKSEHQKELDRLRREKGSLKTDLEILKRPWRTSRWNPREVRLLGNRPVWTIFSGRC